MLGIDDWAWEKGHRYGTILCDLEKRKVVDLLPDREAETVARWLWQHPGTEVVSRDRGGIYAEATRKAVPRAVQVADRWHLLRNVSEALRHALAPHHRLFSQAARAGRIDHAPATPTSVPPWSERERQIQQANRRTGRDDTSDGNRYRNGCGFASAGVSFCLTLMDVAITSFWASLRNLHQLQGVAITQSCP